MVIRTCENCEATYETYKIGTESEMFGYWREFGEGEKKGLCGFCNPKSRWYIGEKEFSKYYDNVPDKG